MWGLGALIGGMAGYTVYHDAWGIGALAGAALGWLIGWRASCRLTEIERRLDVWDARLAALERLARQGEAEPETLPSAPLAAEPLQLLPPHAEASTPPRAGASAPPPAAPRPISPRRDSKTCRAGAGSSVATPAPGLCAGPVQGGGIGVLYLVISPPSGSTASCPRRRHSRCSSRWRRSQP